MQTKKEQLIQLAQNVDMDKLTGVVYNVEGYMIRAIDEFIEVLSKCQEVKEC